MQKILVAVLALGNLLFCTVGYAADEKEKVNLGEIVVTSSGHEENAFDYPGNVTVITSEEIANSNANFIPDILRGEPGIHVFDQTHTGKTATVDIRGFGDTANRNVLVMVDGRRLNEIDNSGIDWAQIPLESVERIEILRGAGSVLYGDNASAGVINIITKKGVGKPTIGYDYETGSYRLNKHLASFQGGTPFLQYAGLGKFQETDGYRLNGYFQGYDYDGNITFNPADYLSINVSGAYHKDWSGMPSGLSRTDIDRIGRRGSTTPTDWAKTETGYFKISPVIQLTKNNPDSSLSLDFWKRKRRSTSETHWVDWGGGFARDSMQINSAGGTIKYLLGYNFGPASNELVLGSDLFNASNRILSVDSMGTYLQLEIRKETFGIYASDKLTILENLILNGGYRYEWAKYVFDEQDVTDDYKLREPEEKAMDIGIEYKYTPMGALYGRFSRSYRFPATDEFFNRWTTPKLNADIKQQQAQTWEVGIKEDTLKYFKTKLNIFIMDVYNEIYLDPSVGGLGSNKNYDHLRRKGAELSINSDVNKYINLYLAYTYINAYFVEGKFAGNRVPMVPANKISWGVILTPFDFLDIHFWSDYVGIERAINDEYGTRPKVKDYTVCNLKASFKCKGWETFFGINNIFNEKYSEYVTSSANNGPNVLYYTAPETNYRFGVSCKF